MKMVSGSMLASNIDNNIGRFFSRNSISDTGMEVLSIRSPWSKTDSAVHNIHSSHCSLPVLHFTWNIPSPEPIPFGVKSRAPEVLYALRFSLSISVRCEWPLWRRYNLLQLLNFLDCSELKCFNSKQIEKRPKTAHAISTVKKCSVICLLDFFFVPVYGY